MFFDTSMSGFGPRRRRSDRRDLKLLSQVETYWHSLAQDGQIPKRSDIDPVDLGDALSHTMIFERVEPGMARVRLAGQALNQIFGMDVRGMPASILVSPASRKAFGTHIEALFSGPSIVELPLQLARGWGRKPVTARLLMMPLCDGFAEPTRAIAVLALDGASMNAQGANRFELIPDGAYRTQVVPHATAVKPSQDPSTWAHTRPDRRKPALETSHDITPARPTARSTRPLFSVVDGGSDVAKLLGAEIKEPRPTLRLVISNDA